MKRALPVLMLCATFFGCRLPEDREGLRPLPEKSENRPYVEMYSRARVQARAALEALYTDNWLDIEQLSQVLEQTARHLPNASDQPDKVKKIVAEESELLRKHAVQLRDAAKSKNPQMSSETLRQIYLVITKLRPPE